MEPGGSGPGATRGYRWWPTARTATTWPASPVGVTHGSRSCCPGDRGHAGRPPSGTNHALPGCGPDLAPGPDRRLAGRRPEMHVLAMQPSGRPEPGGAALAVRRRGDPPLLDARRCGGARGMRTVRAGLSGRVVVELGPLGLPGGTVRHGQRAPRRRPADPHPARPMALPLRGPAAILARPPSSRQTWRLEERGRPHVRAVDDAPVRRSF